MNFPHAEGVRSPQECVSWCSVLPCETICFRSSCRDVVLSGLLGNIIAITHTHPHIHLSTLHRVTEVMQFLNISVFLCIFIKMVVVFWS